MHRSLPLLLLTLAALATGCGSGARQVSVSAWQRNVEQYVKQQGKGDVTILRDVALPDSRRGFSMLGGDRPEESSDAHGVLIGVQPVGGRTWFVYLVGVVKKQKVDEIRLAALAGEGGKTQWKIGPSDKDALRAYQAHAQQTWKQRFPGRATPPPEYLGFPRPEDTFQMSVSGNQVTAIHPTSGARWQLALPPAPQRKG